MAGKSPLHGDDDELLEQPETGEGAETEIEDEEQPEGDEESEEEGGEEGEEKPEPEADEEDGETVISWADDEEPEEGGPDENKVIRKIRERNKELARENAELRRTQTQQQAPQIDIGPKPKMADFNYDEEAYEAAFDAWKDKKATADRVKAEQEASNEEFQREWQRDLANYDQKKTALAMEDYDEVIAPVRTRLTLAQQSVIVKTASDPAAFSYALGNSETRLAELAKIQDPFKFAAAVARMEGGIKVTKRRKTVAPDRPARGSARVAPAGADTTEQKLLKEAEDSGDRTKLIAYRKKKAAKAKAA